MAAPPEITTKNLTGKFYMNKTLSDDTDEVLTLQGVSWFTRKTISVASILLDIKQYRDDDGVEHIDIVQTLTGGIQGTTELRTLDWVEREHKDYLFGTLTGQSRRIKPSEVEDEYLRCGFLSEVEDDGAIESYVINEANKWTARQIWGFEEIDGKRYYARHLKFIKLEDPEKTINRRLVYDYYPEQ
jgi:hypothetical protein